MQESVRSSETYDALLDGGLEIRQNPKIKSVNFRDLVVSWKKMKSRLS